MSASGLRIAPAPAGKSHPPGAAYLTCKPLVKEATVVHDQRGESAVVLGGGMAGLLAARVLSDKYADVVVVDRDKLTGTTGARNGVPHGRHAHCLVARGQQIYEELLPGL